MIKNPDNIILTGLALRCFKEINEGKIKPKYVKNELRLTFQDETHLYAVNGILKETK